MMTNKPNDVDQMIVVDRDATRRQHEALSASQNADEQRQYQRQQQLSQQQQQTSSLLDEGMVIEEYGELADNGTEAAEVLEYPYNQEFSSHPVDWSPMEYIAEDVPSEYSPSSAMKQAPAEAADKADSFDSKDYPYNQYKERILADESYADYSESARIVERGRVRGRRTRHSAGRGGRQVTVDRLSVQSAVPHRWIRQSGDER
jgi:hypothetical protein